MKSLLSLAAAALVVSLAGAALAEGGCGDYGAQTVQSEPTTIVASGPISTPISDSRK